MNDKILKDLVNMVDIRCLINHESQKNLSQKQILQLEKLITIADDEVSAYIFAKNCKGANKEALFDIAKKNKNNLYISLFGKILKRESAESMEKTL